MVRFCDLRLFRHRDRTSLLSARGCGRPAAFSLRRVRARLSDAARRRRGGRPGYATLGLLAPIALTLLRMVQGLSVGGEYTSSMVFLVEHAPDGRRGLMGALASSGASGGILLGSAVCAGFAA